MNTSQSRSARVGHHRVAGDLAVSGAQPRAVALALMAVSALNSENQLRAAMVGVCSPMAAEYRMYLNGSMF